MLALLLLVLGVVYYLVNNWINSDCPHCNGVEYCEEYYYEDDCEYCCGKGYDPINPHAIGGQWGNSGANFQNPCPKCNGTGEK